MLPLEVSAETSERMRGLPLGHSPDERAADNRSDGSQRRTEFIAVVKPRATVLGAQDVFRVSARARRPAALPHSQLVATAVDELPVNLEIDPAHVYQLIHLVAHSRCSVVGVHEPPVN